MPNEELTMEEYAALSPGDRLAFSTICAVITVALKIGEYKVADLLIHAHNMEVARIREGTTTR